MATRTVAMAEQTVVVAARLLVEGSSLLKLKVAG